MRSLYLAIVAFATVAMSHRLPRSLDQSVGYGHGYEDGPNMPPNCPDHPVPQYKSNYERLHAIYTTYCESFLYPNNIKQAKQINSPLFSPDVQGRVDITNTFDGPELNTEYIYGLFVSLAEHSDAVSLLAVPVSYEIRSFITNGNMISASKIVMFKNSVTGKTRPMLLRSNILVDGCDRIQQYDTTFERSEWYMDATLKDFVPVVAKKLGISQDLVITPVLSLALKKEIAKSVCDVEEKFCTGKNRQYKNRLECMAFLMRLDMGKTYQFGQNTIACRSLHSNMVPLRPETHCSHIGMTGGGMCVDRIYDEVTEEVYFKVPMIQTM